MGSKLKYIKLQILSFQKTYCSKFPNLKLRECEIVIFERDTLEDIEKRIDENLNSHISLYGDIVRIRYRNYILKPKGFCTSNLFADSDFKKYLKFRSSIKEFISIKAKNAYLDIKELDGCIGIEVKV